ncbi:MAG: bifunctional UDP-N-acetylglucosamine diphosphorylase/glucosamine-1-phosphate N-acetyltransferase GlmU [Acidobacteria bacterium]|nr:bifunctional UDP-N-acetylglucosamine diphosphorylase/glucosamine-1-phosphate N-acetyltransferase GlmU [Acidobacteriota bacterium]
MSDSSTEQRSLNVLILAAGLGTRMRSDLAKVLHKLDGRPLINHVCRTATALAPESLYVVIGHQGDEVKAAVLNELDGQKVAFVTQEQQLGTGDAVNAARSFFQDSDSTLVVLSGDVPMIRPETLAALVQHHHRYLDRGAACTILTVRLHDPSGYGRIVRDDEGAFERIVEQKDASDEQRQVDEINAGIYCFDTKKLFSALSAVKNNNSQGEYYLTDVPELLRKAGEDVAIFQFNDAQEIEGVNNRAQLADLERILRRRTVSRLMLDSGVTFIDPKNTYVSAQSVIGRDTIIYPNVFIEGSTEIGSGCTIRPGSRLVNAKIGDGVEIRDNCFITDSEVENGCAVGPMAHLRGNAVMAEGSKVGNFVELKKTRLGKGSKASHLTYLGDATIGEDTNIGAGVITCNYDGMNKHETHIGNRVKIGSDTMLVAPVMVGDDAVTGAGSVVTKDIDANALVVGAPAKKIKDLQSGEEKKVQSGR